MTAIPKNSFCTENKIIWLLGDDRLPRVKAVKQKLAKNKLHRITSLFMFSW